MRSNTIVLSLATFLSTVSAKGCWKTLTPIASGTRQEHGAAAVGKDVYIVGGIWNNTWGTTHVDKYDTTLDKWSAIPPAPRGLHHANVAGVNGKLYVLGGMTADEGWPAVGASFSYDPETQKWETLENMPNARAAAAVGVHKDKIYIAGGVTAKAKATKFMSAFDTVAKKWTSFPDLDIPEPRDHVGGAMIGDTFYVVGGRLNYVLKSTTYALNVVKPEKWENVAMMKQGRGGMAVAAVGDKIYAFGGEGNPDQTYRGVFPNSDVFDSATKKWGEEVQMKAPRHGTGGSTVGDWVYIAGGGAKQGGGADLATLDAFGPGPC